MPAASRASSWPAASSPWRARLTRESRSGGWGGGELLPPASSHAPRPPPGTAQLQARPSRPQLLTRVVVVAVVALALAGALRPSIAVHSPPPVCGGPPGPGGGVGWGWGVAAGAARQVQVAAHLKRGWARVQLPPPPASLTASARQPLARSLAAKRTRRRPPRAVHQRQHNLLPSLPRPPPAVAAAARGGGRPRLLPSNP